LEVATDWHELLSYRSVLRSHPLTTPANNWTYGLQVADMPPPKQTHTRHTTFTPSCSSFPIRLRVEG